jgi:thiamine pyrophosphate-dependent acetolactate synthase large subunit-like protein
LDAVAAGAGSWDDVLEAVDEPDIAQPPVELAPGTVHPRDAMLRLGELAAAESRFAIGIGHFWQWPLDFLRGRDASSYFVVPEFGAIGQTFAGALGAAVADPSRRMVLIEGDGSLMMSMQELDTAVRYGIDILVVVMNDNGLAAEFHKLDSEGIDSEVARIQSPDFASVARALGARAVRAESIDDVAVAVRELQAERGPALIDIRISDAVINDSFWNAFFAEDRRAAY